MWQKIRKFIDKVPRRRLVIWLGILGLICVAGLIFAFAKGYLKIGADVVKKTADQNANQQNKSLFYGRLVAKDGKPFNGAITLSAKNGPISAQTDEKGYFTFNNIEPGYYVYSLRDKDNFVWGSKQITEPTVSVPAGDKAFEKLEILDLEKMGLNWTVKDYSDNYRRAHLAELKNALDTYYKYNNKYPETDGWIENRENGSLVNSILKEKWIDNIPCDPRTIEKVSNCTSNTYQYWRHDYDQIKGNPKSYSLYAKLDNLTDVDKATMNTGNEKMNTKAKEYGMNYRVSGGEPDETYGKSISNDSARLSYIDKLKSALEKYKTQNGIYPDTAKPAVGKYTYGLVYSDQPNYYYRNTSIADAKQGAKGVVVSWNTLLSMLKQYDSALQTIPENTKIVYGATPYDYKIWLYGLDDKDKMKNDGGERPSIKAPATLSCSTTKLPQSSWAYEMFTKNNSFVWGWGCHYQMSQGYDGSPIIKKIASAKINNKSWRVDWQGYDIEDGSKLTYRYKIDSGQWSNWSQGTYLSGLATNKSVEVEVKDSSGKTAKAKIIIK